MPLLDAAVFLALFGGATMASDPAAYRAASPIFLVSQHSAPTLTVQGNADTTVPPEQSRMTDPALRRAGVAVTYVSYAGGHAFGGVSTEGRAAIHHTEVQCLRRRYSGFR